jgi:predicted alpha/beta-fold hydrolase
MPGDRAALLIHGLAGCHGSPYMRWLAAKLRARGIRPFRMDLRGCGAGAQLARLPYHSGRSEDAAAALRFVAELCPGSPTTLIGFSLGGNITLKLLGELGDKRVGTLDRAVAVSPPVDLLACVRSISRGANRWYDRYFVAMLLRRLEERRKLMPEMALVEFARRPATLFDFDDQFTAPVCGFGTAERYYHECSSLHSLPHIRIPTLILASRDDPMVPCQPFETTRLPAAMQLELTDHGGHLGFIARRGLDPDRRWMDWRILDWLGEGR